MDFDLDFEYVEHPFLAILVYPFIKSTSECISQTVSHLWDYMTLRRQSIQFFQEGLYIRVGLTDPNHSIEKLDLTS